MLMGAHAAPPVRLSFVIFLLVVVVVLSFRGTGAVVEEEEEEEDESSGVQALLQLKNSLSNAGALYDWDASTSPCGEGERSWSGVICSGGNIWGLQLENLSLAGEIDVDALVGLRQLRTLSFMNNNFEGPLPHVGKLGALKSLFLSNNRFSGEIPDDAFVGMSSLKKVYMANNKFTGNIPTSLAATPRLIELRLEDNLFVGRIPDFPTPDLKLLNLSNNQLEGPIPPNLTNMDPASFSGNIDLCGQPLDSICDSSSPPPSPPKPASPPVLNTSTYDDPPALAKKKSSPLRIVVIVIAILVALAAIVVLLAAYRSRSAHGVSERPQVAPDSQLGSGNGVGECFSSSSSQPENQNENKVSMSGVGVGHSTRNTKSNNDKQQQQQHGGKLSFVREDRQRFELQDLLRASAEVLGSGSFGSSYKAVLMEPEGQAVVVKRFKQMSNVGKEDFHEHMRRLGRLRHPNLLPLVAYYYRKEEKLLVFDYVYNGSLATQLHGKHTVGGLDWAIRLKIIKGVAKGLAYLHSELPSLMVPHGHLKSSNVLLDKSFQPLLMDYSLVPLVNPEMAQQLMVAYKSPEFYRHGRTTKKSDVWTLGILILELLTGKLPPNYHDTSWVNSIQQNSTQVFDKEMEWNTSININPQGEMLKLLRIGVACCEEDLETRLDLKEAVERIELVTES